VPRPVRSLAGVDRCEPVWRNGSGGLTFRLRGAGGVRYVKWEPVCGGALAAEVERLTWAIGFTAVPAVLGHGQDEGGCWLLTRGLMGRSAVDPRWVAEPARAALAIGSGLRALHDALPTDLCRFDWSARTRVAAALARVDAGRRPGADEHADLSAAEVRARLADVPDLDPVVCHGDACAPNTLIDDDGRCAGHVDLGALGTGDRWADLAVAAWSMTWNYGPGYERAVYEAYGTEPDVAKIAYYRLLWDVG
jgi:kanamycin kinase